MSNDDYEEFIGPDKWGMSHMNPSLYPTTSKSQVERFERLLAEGFHQGLQRLYATAAT